MKAPELTDLAIEWLKEYAPDSIIVRELSVADWGAASIDVAAITPTQIVGVEIKGEGDSPARLDRQGIAYGMAVREMWLLPDVSIREKCFGKRPPGWGRLEVWDGYVRRDNRARKPGEWVKSKTGLGGHIPYIRDDSRYEPDGAQRQMHQTPSVMCGVLWRDELYEIARVHRLECRGPALVGPLTEIICESLPAPMIHDEMIRALRARVWRKDVIDCRKLPHAPPTPAVRGML